MSYQHPSGATKRKRKREEMLSLKKIQKSLFFNPAPKQSQPSEFRGQRSQDASKATNRTNANEENLDPQSSEGCMHCVNSPVTASIEVFH